MNAEETGVRNIVVISDLHCGCRVGLCPPSPSGLDSGGTYTHSKVQAEVWIYWETFWNEWVPMVTHGEPFGVVVNGDALDGVHHRSTTQISQNHSDQIAIARETLEPIRDRCEGRFYMIRGTEAHVGQSAENEEILATLLGAVPNEHGRGSRYELWIRMGRGLIHLSHHIGTTGSSHYESSAVLKELTEMFTESARWDDARPDIVVRSHRHRHIEIRVPTSLGYGISFVTAGWQLRTPFAYKIPGGRISTPQVGGSLIRLGDEDLFTRHATWRQPREDAITI